MADYSIVLKKSLKRVMSRASWSAIISTGMRKKESQNIVGIPVSLCFCIDFANDKFRDGISQFIL